MNKIIPSLLTVLLTTNLVACSSTSTTTESSTTSTSTSEEVVGDYETSISSELTDETTEIFTKGTEGMTGATYSPVALLATQIVSGTNYRFLATCKQFLQDESEETETYAIVEIYEDLKGNVELKSIINSEFETYLGEGLTGGWTAAESTELTEEASKAFEATKEDSKTSALVFLATQVVSGTNYRILCEKDDTYYIETIYEDLNGNYEVTDTQTFDQE